MEFEVFIAVSVGSLIIVIGAIIWMKHNLAKAVNEELLSELNEKRDLAAQVPLLNSSIEALREEKRVNGATIDQLRTLVSEKEVLLAKNEKDRMGLSATIEDIEAVVAREQVANRDLKEVEQLLRNERVELKSVIDQQEYGMQKDRERFEEQIKAMKTRLDTLKEELHLANEKIANYVEEIKQINADRSTLQANLNAQKEKSEQFKHEFTEQSKKLELKLNAIMQENLDGKLKKFDETSMKSLEGLLKPFKENLETFKKRVEDSQENSTKKFAELSKEIEQVMKAGLHISQEANNLTKALKGKKQTQGSWGEMILESVLEYSGLLKGVHYETQTSFKDEEGNTKRPDVVVKLPQDRTIIIDSKVSLNDYDRYIRAQSDEERTLATKDMVSAFKNHIDTLDSKDYAHYKIGTLQYVFMFVPIEGAFAMAVQHDQELYEYALKKHIAIVTPSTLTVSLRTIYLYWQSEQSNSLAGKLFDEAGKLYDKMVGFSDNFRKIGEQIDTVNKTYDRAHKQLTEGSGNLMGRVENLKRLGARTSKTLKNSKIEFHDFDEVDVEVEVIEEPLGIEK
jgi:DNA recombination protein RmuC